MTNIVVSPPKQKGRKESMSRFSESINEEEKRVLEFIVNSSRSIDELYEKLGSIESGIDFFVDEYSSEKNFVRIGLNRSVSVLAIDNGKPFISSREKWSWYTIIPQKGSIFDW